MNFNGLHQQCDRRYWVFTLFLAISYGAVLSMLPADAFKDRANYLSFVADAAEILRARLGAGLVGIAINEPIWAVLNWILGTFLSPVQTVRVLIFTSAFVVAWTVCRQGQCHPAWIIVILLSPFVITRYIVHLRQGAAIAVFAVGWYCKTKWIRWSLLLATPLIHVSFFFVIGLLLMNRLARVMRLGPDLQVLAFLTAGLVSGLLVEPAASLVNARQVSDYSFDMAEVSGLGLVFWAALLAIMFSQGRRYLRKYTFEVGSVAFYIGNYFVLDFGARIFESTVLFVLLAGVRLRGLRKLAFVGAILLHSILEYASRVGLPALGFGVN